MIAKPLPCLTDTSLDSCLVGAVSSGDARKRRHVQHNQLCSVRTIPCSKSTTHPTLSVLLMQHTHEYSLHSNNHHVMLMDIHIASKSEAHWTVVIRTSALKCLKLSQPTQMSLICRKSIPGCDWFKGIPDTTLLWFEGSVWYGSSLRHSYTYYHCCSTSIQQHSN